MTELRLLISALALSWALHLSLADLSAADGVIVISKTPVPGGDSCHLKFPAIREDTLFSSRPVLKDPKDGDVIDFYGACDHDPLGQWEIARQRADVRRDRRNDQDSD